jgi:plasmid maintenance system antidote protein VapI
MRLRNNNFAAAFDEMKRRGIVKTQKELAHKMGVSEDTITRILKDRTEVTEDVITKLQTASGCLFNLQWLRGESNIMLAEDVQKQTIANPPAQESAPIDMDFFHQALKINADVIADLRRNVEYFQQLVLDKDSLIQEHNEQIVALNIDKAKLATELEHLRTTLDAVRNNFDAKVTELEKRDQIIKTLQSVIDRESRGDYRIPTGVAEPPAAYNNDKK